MCRMLVNEIALFGCLKDYVCVKQDAGKPCACDLIDISLNLPDLFRSSKSASLPDVIFLVLRNNCLH